MKHSRESVGAHRDAPTGGSRTAPTMDRFIGIPFRENQSSFKGTDCWGLVCLFYREIFRIELPHYQVACADAVLRARTINGMVDRELTTGKWRKVDHFEFGNVVLLSTNSKAVMLKNHIGVFVGDNRILHTTRILGSHKVRADSHMAGLIQGYYEYTRQ